MLYCIILFIIIIRAIQDTQIIHYFLNKFLFQLGTDPAKWEKDGVQKILRSNTADVKDVTKSSLKKIANELHPKFIVDALHQRIVRGIHGKDVARLATEVALQAEISMEISPKLLHEYISVINGNNAAVAGRMKEQHEGEDLCHI